MHMDTIFPSNYLKASDLQGGSPIVTIDRIEMQDIGDDRKPVLYFQGKEKGLVLNKTNATNISTQYGKETGNWIGKRVKMFETLVDFQGKSVPAIRVMPVAEFASGLSEQGYAAASRAEAPTQTRRDLDDEIPF